MLVNLINISYCAMNILPYQNEHFFEYRTKSTQEFCFELSQGIRSQIFFATFAKNIETHIKSNAMTKALKQLIHQHLISRYQGCLEAEDSPLLNQQLTELVRD